MPVPIVTANQFGVNWRIASPGLGSAYSGQAVAGRVGEVGMRIWVTAVSAEEVSESRQLDLAVKRVISVDVTQ